MSFASSDVALPRFIVGPYRKTERMNFRSKLWFGMWLFNVSDKDSIVINPDQKVCT